MIPETQKNENGDPIINDDERAYLSGALRPFLKHGEVKRIYKKEYSLNPARAYIVAMIDSTEIQDAMVFPTFSRKKKYLNMHYDEPYTPEELGLDYRLMSRFSNVGGKPNAEVD